MSRHTTGSPQVKLFRKLVKIRILQKRLRAGAQGCQSRHRREEWILSRPSQSTPRTCTPPLDTVRDQIEKNLKESKAYELASQKGNSLLEQLKRKKTYPNWLKPAI
jgi:hypothetical protein